MVSLQSIRGQYNYRNVHWSPFLIIVYTTKLPHKRESDSSVNFAQYAFLILWFLYMNKLILWRDVAPRLKSGELRLINFENGFTIFPYISLNFFFLLFSEKCQNLRIKSYPCSNTNNCRAHWACNFGKATTTCCPEGFRYVPYRSCVEDFKCKDICPPTFHQEGQCDIRLIFNSPTNMSST